MTSVDHGTDHRADHGADHGADPPVRNHVVSAGLVLAGAALFGTVGTAQAIGPVVPVGQLACVRLVLAGLLLCAVAAATRQLRAIGPMFRCSPTWWAVLGQAGFNLCFLGAMFEAGVAVGTLIAIGATPILTGLATRQVSRNWLVATGIAVTGLVLLVGGQASGDGPPVSVAGIALALGASASYATYIIAGNAAASRGLETAPFLGAAFAGAGLLTLPLLLLGEVTWVGTAGGALLVGYLALVPTVLAYHLFNRGLRGVRPSTASTLGLIEPVVAAGLAFVLLGERLAVVGTLGAALILVGLLLIVRTVEQDRDPAPGELVR